MENSSDSGMAKLTTLTDGSVYVSSIDHMYLKGNHTVVITGAAYYLEVIETPEEILRSLDSSDPTTEGTPT